MSTDPALLASRLACSMLAKAALRRVQHLPTRRRQLGHRRPRVRRRALRQHDVGEALHLLAVAAVARIARRLVLAVRPVGLAAETDVEVPVVPQTRLNLAELGAVAGPATRRCVAPAAPVCYLHRRATATLIRETFLKKLSLIGIAVAAA